MIQKVAARARLPMEEFDDFVQYALAYVLYHFKYRNDAHREISIKDIETYLSGRVGERFHAEFSRGFRSPVPVILMNYAQSMGVFREKSPYFDVDFTRGYGYRTFLVDTRCTRPPNSYWDLLHIRMEVASAIAREEPVKVDKIPVESDYGVRRKDARDFIRAILDLFPRRLGALYVAVMLFEAGSEDIFEWLGLEKKEAVRHLRAMQATIEMVFNADGEVICDKALEREIRAAKARWPEEMPYCRAVLEKIEDKKVKLNNNFTYSLSRRCYNNTEETIDEAVYRFIQGCYQDIAD